VVHHRREALERAALAQAVHAPLYRRRAQVDAARDVVVGPPPILEQQRKYLAVERVDAVDYCAKGLAIAVDGKPKGA
jgi:hypothetical protein